MSLKLDRHSNWNAPQIGISPKFECHLNLNTTQIEMSLKLNVTQIKMSLNLECHSNWNVTQIGM